MATTRHPKAKLPSIHNWKTTDEDEIARHRHRTQTESLLRTGIRIARALSVKNRIAEPGSLEDALRSPYAFLWGETLATIRDYTSNASAAAAPAAAALRTLTGEPAGEQTTA
jgi:hypothetical protein